ncbi:MAG: hypothetical protein FWF51_12410 [Chitinivibrionia bacterium]|nr:hypothetical protein [Chitinivibrionia bacterium]
MMQVVVSSNYNIEFPQEFIEKSNIRPGNIYSVGLSGENIYLASVPSIKKLRGTLKKSDYSDIRDESERML